MEYLRNYNFRSYWKPVIMGFMLFALILYIIWDVNYFLRCIFTVLAGRIFQSKRKVTDTTCIYGKSTYHQPTRYSPIESFFD